MSCALVVKVPEALDAKNARKLGRELKSKFSSDSPFVVLDFSRVKDIDLPGFDGLLSCMNEVARQDGGSVGFTVATEVVTVNGVSVTRATITLTWASMAFRSSRFSGAGFVKAVGSGPSATVCLPCSSAASGMMTSVSRRTGAQNNEKVRKR